MPKTTAPPTPLHFRGAAEAGSPRLAGLPGVDREESSPVVVLEVERYDTDDLRLAAAGITLSLHRGDGRAPGGSAQWHLDLPDGDRDERLRVPVAADVAEPAPVPAQIDELIRGAARDRAVRPVGRARTTRAVTRLLAADDSVLAEVVHDHVSVATLGRSTDVRTWTEAALDLRPGAPEGLLDRLAESGLTPAAPGVDAALDRLLRPASARRARAGKKGSAGAALMAYVATQADRLAAEDLRVRRDEPDAVHQLRVASRRLRSALQAYRPLLDVERTEPVVEALRRFGQALAPARDAEVLRERVLAGLADLPPELRLGHAEAFATRHFARVEAEARAAVLTELDGDRYAALRGALEALLEEPPLTRAARGKSGLRTGVARATKRLAKAVDAAVAPGPEQTEAVHAARKAGKRLRYATEVAGTKDRSLKRLQKALGEHQDAVVAATALRELGAAAHASGENGFSFGVLLGRDVERAVRIERDLPQLWAGVRGRK
ncbi:CYTH and CHAD domain-containing protein [Pseudonocardia petroleophila]|uniref:CYTH and CHAD domain-containing protein n=1 Tax=Pseudonocardia petroleophila TaxID=37331 RepID=A0A7G7MIF5_9PSEU|nr:CYTH and CHAD domain-containing protein [Pseudonocardia petroleophila]QNG52566.1 CYTH and CHAD domain-containing protein [Pseudonocardia petroleophila]